MPSGFEANILLVDDRAENLLALHAILEDLGHNLVEARSGQEALARVAERQFAVILLDVQMPVMDGFEAAKLIRQVNRARHTPIVFLTAYESDEFPVDQAYSLGAVDYLVKPFVPVILRAKVRGFVQLFEQTERIHEQAKQIQELQRQQFERTIAEKNARLRESDALTTAIVETALDCIVTMDHRGKVIEFNPAAEAVFGFKRAAAIGKDVADLFIPPAYRQSHWEGLASCLRTGEGSLLGQRLELPAIRADGTEIAVELAVTRIPHRDPPIFAAYLRDITERKRAERRRNARLAVTQALAQADSLQQAAVEILQAIGEGAGWHVGMLWSVPTEGKFLVCDAVWQTSAADFPHFKAFSRDLKLAFGQGLPGRIWSSGEPAWIEDVTREPNFPRAAVARQDGLRGAFGFPVLSGKEVLAIVEFFSHEVREPDPDLLEMAATLGSYIGQFMERKRAEEVLRASERRFALFMDQLPGLAWIKDEKGRYIYANAAAEKAFGTPLAQLHGRTDDEIFSPETAAQFTAHDEQARANDAGIQVIETLANAEGELRHSLVCKFPIPSREGDWRLVGGMAVDITDRLQAEQALREADRLKNQFLAMLAHELRNPLAPLTTGLELLRLSQGNLQDEIQTIDTMQRQLSQMVRLIDDLLDVSRITQGKMGLRRGPCELTSILTTAIESSRPVLTKAGVELSVQLPDSPIHLDADADRLAQVFSNLLNNSAKFTPRGGKVWLQGGQEANDIVVSVRDTGIGIPADMLGHVFGMFTQVDRSLERAHGGLGIGLSLVKAIVELHGGVVTAESPGLAMGSIFTVRAPVVAENHRAYNQVALAAPARETKSCRVLIVDDNVDAAKMLAMLLKINGCEVQTAFDGQEAVRAAAVFRPDIAFLDIGLPKLSGYDVALRIRELPFGKQIVLAALTGWGQNEDRERTRQAGFDHHLVKPAEIELVLQLVRTVTDRQ